MSSLFAVKTLTATFMSSLTKQQKQSMKTASAFFSQAPSLLLPLVDCMLLFHQLQLSVLHLFVYMSFLLYARVFLCVDKRWFVLEI